MFLEETFVYCGFDLGDSTVSPICSSCGAKLGYGQEKEIPGKGIFCRDCFTVKANENRTPEMKEIVELALQRHDNHNDDGLHSHR